MFVQSLHLSQNSRKPISGPCPLVISFLEASSNFHSTQTETESEEEHTRKSVPGINRKRVSVHTKVGSAKVVAYCNGKCFSFGIRFAEFSFCKNQTADDKILATVDGSDKTSISQRPGG